MVEGTHFITPVCGKSQIPTWTTPAWVTLLDSNWYIKSKSNQNNKKQLDQPCNGKVKSEGCVRRTPGIAVAPIRFGWLQAYCQGLKWRLRVFETLRSDSRAVWKAFPFPKTTVHLQNPAQTKILEVTFANQANTKKTNGLSTCLDMPWL